MRADVLLELKSFLDHPEVRGIVFPVEVARHVLGIAEVACEIADFRASQQEARETDDTHAEIQAESDLEEATERLIDAVRIARLAVPSLSAAVGDLPFGVAEAGPSAFAERTVPLARRDQVRGGGR